jgi:hypothetical protein
MSEIFEPGHIARTSQTSQVAHASQASQSAQPSSLQTRRGSNSGDPAVDQLYSRGRLVQMPSLRGKNQTLRGKLLRHIATTAFEPGRVYSESEVNERLFSVYDDYTALRRYLVEERCLTRDRAGSRYQLAEGISPAGPAPAERPVE